MTAERIAELREVAMVCHSAANPRVLNLASSLDEALDALEAALLDVERLDWAQSNRDLHIEGPDIFTDDKWAVFAPGRFIFRDKSLRAAIDAARAAIKKEQA